MRDFDRYSTKEPDGSKRRMADCRRASATSEVRPRQDEFQRPAGSSTDDSHGFHHLPGMLVEIDGRNVEETEGIGRMTIFDAAKVRSICGDIEQPDPSEASG
jgi:hypothetical protein